MLFHIDCFLLGTETLYVYPSLVLDLCKGWRSSRLTRGHYDTIFVLNADL